MKTEKNKLIISILIVVAIIATVIGSTYAYWKWTTSEEQRTSITISVGGGKLNINGTNVSNTSMYPTNSCRSSAVLKGSSTVTAQNETETTMTVTLKLTATLATKQGEFKEGDKAKLKWAIVDTSDTNASCSKPTASGTFADVTIDTDIETGITYPVTAKTTSTKNYDLYVWLDSSYESENIGTTVSDPMQNLTLVVKWSENSTLVQS